MNDNFIPTVTIALSVYESMEKQITEESAKFRLIEQAIETYCYALSIPKATVTFVPKSELEQKFYEVVKHYENRIAELTADNERLCRIVDGLQVQHRNDQGLD